MKFEFFLFVGTALAIALIGGIAAVHAPIVTMAACFVSAGLLFVCYLASQSDRR